MGALFFFILIAILFFVALFFIILTTIFIISWNIRKRKGKNPKKQWLMISVIFLIINIIIAFIPIAYIGFLRYVNTSNKEIITYAEESGTILYWPMGEYEPTTSWFEMNGKKYVQFREGFSNDKFYIDYNSESLGKPVANIKYDPSSSSFLEDLMGILLSGSTFSEQNISTVIPVKNENGFEFYYVKNSPGSATFAGATYCEKDTLASIKAYYADIANYDTQNLICKYYVYTKGQGISEKNGHPYDRIEKKITLKAETFIELQNLYDSKESIDVEVPRKYKDDDEKGIPGTPVDGYKEKKLCVYSNDKMVYMEVNMILLEDQVYVGYFANDDNLNGCSLPDEMNQYIIDNVFN